ncbi:MAG: sulfite exporter TauE/SafE family protein [Peptococcaceae bacterium]|nr:sulfite exporter TauE/SafE family protein [Peptococcaceae bacterium]
MIYGSENLVTIFTIGLMIGILGGIFGTPANMLAVPVLGIFGLPLSISAGTSVGQSFGQTSLSILIAGPDPTAFRRLGIVTGIIGLPGVFFGVKLNLFLMGTGNGVGKTVIYLCYIALLLSASVVIFRQWHFFNRNDYYEDAPFPPFGLNWRFPPAIPGGAGMKHITLARTLLVGFLLGITTGFLGLGAGVLGIPLFMYILGLPAKSAAATDTVAMMIIGSGALFGYASAGRVELLLVLVFLAAVTLGNHIGAVLPGELNLSHARLAFSLLLAVSALSVTVGLHNIFFSHLIMSVSGPGFCLAVAISSLVSEKSRTGKAAP